MVAELSELMAAHPMRQGFAGLLMLACYQSGRLADALSAYRHTRKVLVDELGTEPSGHLQDDARADNLRESVTHARR